MGGAGAFAVGTVTGGAVGAGVAAADAGVVVPGLGVGVDGAVGVGQLAKTALKVGAGVAADDAADNVAAAGLEYVGQGGNPGPDE